MSDGACYNCGTPLTGPFCAVCGQKALYFGILALVGSRGFPLTVKADSPQDADAEVQTLGFSGEHSWPSTAPPRWR